MAGIGLLTVGVMAGVLAGDWVSTGRLLTDAYCRVAHDKISGAVVSDCSSGFPIDARAKDPRLIAARTERIGRKTLEIREFREPGDDLRRLRADIGDQPASCPIEELLKAHAPAEPCSTETVIVVRKGKKLLHRYDALICSDAQRNRVVEYVRAALQGAGPEVIDCTRERGGRPIALDSLGDVAGKPIEVLLATYGPPGDSWPHYPDGLTWVYPLAGEDTKAAAIDIDRTHVVAGVRIICPAE